MPFGQPTDTNPEAWYTAAQRIDQAWLANEAFQSTLHSTTSTPMHSALPQLTLLLVLCPPSVALPPVSLRPPPPTPSRGISMDIDAVQKTRFLPPQGCYQCGEANHLMKDYLHYLDIQRLTAEQREELIEDLMALKYAVEKEEVCLTPEEDFA